MSAEAVVSTVLVFVLLAALSVAFGLVLALFVTLFEIGWGILR